MVHPAAWVLPLLLLGYPIVGLLNYAFGNLDNQWPSILFRLGLAGFALAIVVAGSQPVARQTRQLALVLIAVWLLFALRIVVDTQLRLASAQYSMAEYLGYLLIFTAMPAMAGIRPLSEQAIVHSARSVVVLAIPFLALMAYFVGDFYFSVGDPRLGRVGIDNVNPILIGNTAGSLLIVGLYVLRNRFHQPLLPALPAATVPIAIGLSAAAIILLIFAASRGPILATIAALGVLFIRPFSWEKFFLGFLGMIFLFLAFHFFAEIAEQAFGVSVLARINSLLMDPMSDVSTYMRIESFTGAFGQFLDSPLTGDALIEKNTQFYPHNAILEAFMATGVVGGGLLVFAYFVGSIAAVKVADRFHAGAFIGALTVQYLVSSMITDALYRLAPMFYLILLSVAISHDRFISLRHVNQSRQRNAGIARLGERS